MSLRSPGVSQEPWCLSGHIRTEETRVPSAGPVARSRSEPGRGTKVRRGGNSVTLDGRGGPSACGRKARVFRLHHPTGPALPVGELYLDG